MKNKRHNLRKFAEAWEGAAERAAQEQNRQPSLDETALNDAAGLRVESGVKGGWTSTCSCHQSCGTCLC